MESLTTGTLAGTGSFRCEICGHVVTMTTADVLPPCPGCAGASFTRASLFGPGRAGRLARTEVTPAPDGQLLIDSARDAITEPGRYLIFKDTGTIRTVEMPGDSMRIGRSLSADLRFEDPTVSRRHAVLILESGGVRVLDDRSLNGVFVNGDPVEWSSLSDGDELAIGRYRLHVIDTTGSPAGAGRHALTG
jgi:pSer/pThr/pTyr-binding forkhead associated (FHA) protein